MISLAKYLLEFSGDPLQGPCIMLVTLLMNFLLAYAVIGAVITFLFLVIGIDRIDPTARGAYAFRPLLIPGGIILWPLLAWRWWLLEQELKK